jgi:hypothetical protein
MRPAFGWVNNQFKKVVLPLPKNPVMMSTGVGSCTFGLFALFKICF